MLIQSSMTLLLFACVGAVNLGLFFGPWREVQNVRPGFYHLYYFIGNRQTGTNLTDSCSDLTGCSVTTLTPSSSDPGLWCSCRPVTCSVITPPFPLLGFGSKIVLVRSTSISIGGMGVLAGVMDAGVPGSLSKTSSHVVSPSAPSSSSSSEPRANRISGARSFSERSPCWDTVCYFIWWFDSFLIKPQTSTRQTFF